MSARHHHWRLLLPLLLLAGCASVPRPQPGTAGDPQQMRAQAQREAELGGLAQWQLQGRLGISNADDANRSGSGSLSWRQQGTEYSFTLDGGFGHSFRLTGGPQGAALEGIGKQPLQGPDAEDLMRQAVGWSVPLDQLRAWAMGLRAPSGGAAQLQFGANGLPSQLQQDGWRVEYRQWDTSRQPALPSFVVASRPPYSVRLRITDWQLH